jgi:hypothetical protein
MAQLTMLARANDGLLLAEHSELAQSELEHFRHDGKACSFFPAPAHTHLFVPTFVSKAPSTLAYASFHAKLINNPILWVLLCSMIDAGEKAVERGFCGQQRVNRVRRSLLPLLNKQWRHLSHTRVPQLPSQARVPRALQ